MIVAVLDENNIVVNLIVANSVEDAAALTRANCVDGQDKAIGDVLDSNGIVAPPQLELPI